MPARRALGLPEVLSNVLYQLSTTETLAIPTEMAGEIRRRTPSLLPCVLVNKLWADEATKLLWTRITPKKLLQVPPTRRQYYATNIESIQALSTCCSNDPSNIEKLNQLEWPKLKDIFTHISASSDKTDTAFVDFRPFREGMLRIKGVRMRDQNSSDFICSQATSSASTSKPYVRALEIDDSDATTSQDVLTFLNENPSVNHVSLLSTKVTKDPAILDFLAQKPNLTSLSIVMDPSDPVMPNLGEDSFPALRKLSFAGRPETLSHLLPYIGGVSDISITILGNLGVTVKQQDIDELLESLRFLPDLEDLHIRTKVWGMMSTTQLVLKPALLTRLAQGCHLIKSLNVDLNSGPDTSALTDTDLARISKALPHLEDLQLCMKPWLSKLTWRGIQAVGQHSRRLRTLHLGADIHLDDLPCGTEVLFPRLRSFMLGLAPQGMDTYARSTKPISSALATHFPLLEKVHLPRTTAISNSTTACEVDGYGFFRLEPSTADRSSNSLGRHGPGSHVLIARQAIEELPSAWAHA